MCVIGLTVCPNRCRISLPLFLRLQLCRTPYYITQPSVQVLLCYTFLVFEGINCSVDRTGILIPLSRWANKCKPKPQYIKNISLRQGEWRLKVMGLREFTQHLIPPKQSSNQMTVSDPEGCYLIFTVTIVTKYIKPARRGEGPAQFILI